MRTYVLLALVLATTLSACESDYLNDRPYPLAAYPNEPGRLGMLSPKSEIQEYLTAAPIRELVLTREHADLGIMEQQWTLYELEQPWNKWYLSNWELLLIVENDTVRGMSARGGNLLFFRPETNVLEERLARYTSALEEGGYEVTVTEVQSLKN